MIKYVKFCVAALVAAMLSAAIPPMVSAPSDVWAMCGFALLSTTPAISYYLARWILK
jgi:hypothetical protein